MSLVEFEKQKVVKSFMDTLDVYHTNLGGYHYRKDGSPCYCLNGMLTMFEEQQKKIDLLETELTETQAFLNKQNHIKQAKIDELQARIDEVLKACDNLRTDLIRENHVEYDKGWKDCATSIYHQLKGNKDEK